MARIGPYVCETLVCGGPRHGKHEELCEDSAGVISFPGGTVFYVVDATSDEARLGPFSSRYFANSLGFWFMKSCFEAMGASDSNLDMDQVFSSALDGLYNAWEKEFERFWERPGSQDEFEAVCEPFIFEGERGSMLSFSTTFCGGAVFAEGRKVQLVRTGDIDLVVKRNGTAPDRKPIRKERIFAQLIKKGDGRPKFNFPDLPYEKYSSGLMEFIVVKTDGVKFSNDELTFGALSGGTVEDVLKFRKILLKGIRSNTGDDKALLYCAFIQ